MTEGREPTDAPPGDGGDPVQRGADGLVENYRTILNELSLLTTVSVLLFGFLLASAGIADSRTEEILYAVAIVLVATATLVFVLPVIYHHLQYPYRDFEKFQERTHGWMILGFPLLAGSLHLSLSLAIWSLLSEWALLAAALPLGGTFAAFLLRRRLF